MTNDPRRAEEEIEQLVGRLNATHASRALRALHRDQLKKLKRLRREVHKAEATLRNRPWHATLLAWLGLVSVPLAVLLTFFGPVGFGTISIGVAWPGYVEDGVSTQVFVALLFFFSGYGLHWLGCLQLLRGRAGAVRCAQWELVLVCLYFPVEIIWSGRQLAPLSLMSILYSGLWLLYLTKTPRTRTWLQVKSSLRISPNSRYLAGNVPPPSI